MLQSLAGSGLQLNDGFVENAAGERQGEIILSEEDGVGMLQADVLASVAQIITDSTSDCEVLVMLLWCKLFLELWVPLCLYSVPASRGLLSILDSLTVFSTHSLVSRSISWGAHR